MSEDFYQEQYGLEIISNKYFIKYLEEKNLFGDYVDIDLSQGYEAEAIIIPGFEEYDFFAHHLYYPRLKEYTDTCWVISEGASGASMTSKWPLIRIKEKLIKKLSKNLIKAGKTSLNEGIQRAIDKSGGIVPRYKKLVKI